MPYEVTYHRFSDSMQIQKRERWELFLSEMSEHRESIQRIKQVLRLVKAHRALCDLLQQEVYNEPEVFESGPAVAAATLSSTARLSILAKEAAYLQRIEKALLWETPWDILDGKDLYTRAKARYTTLQQQAETTQWVMPLTYGKKIALYTRGYEKPIIGEWFPSITLLTPTESETGKPVLDGASIQLPFDDPKFNSEGAAPIWTIQAFHGLPEGTETTKVPLYESSLVTISTLKAGSTTPLFLVPYSEHEFGTSEEAVAWRVRIVDAE